MGPFLAALVAAVSPVVILTGEASVPAGRIAGLELPCPPGVSPASGGVLAPAPDVVTLRSEPGTGRVWRFRFLNPEGADDARVAVSIACVRGAVVRTVSRTVRSGVKPVTIGCPGGFFPSGFGWDTAPSDGLFHAMLGWTLRSAQPTRSGWTIGPVDLAAGSHDVSGPLALRARCIDRPTTVGRSYRHRIRSGENTFTHPCARPLGGGFSLSDGFLDGVAVSGGGAVRWTIFTQFAGTAELTPVCLD